MRPCLKRIQRMPNVPLAYVSVYRRMSDIFHTLAYASTIRNSVTGPLDRAHTQESRVHRGVPAWFITERITVFNNFSFENLPSADANVTGTVRRVTRIFD